MEPPTVAIMAVIAHTDNPPSSPGAETCTFPSLGTGVVYTSVVVSTGASEVVKTSGVVTSSVVTASVVTASVVAASVVTASVVKVSVKQIACSLKYVKFLHSK